ncbi:MAG: hypothetical protein ACL93V_01610 [Candidatus Electrothrix sp. YB6]
MTWQIDEISNKKRWSNALSLAEKFDFYHTWDFHVISRDNGEGAPVLFKISTKNAGLLIPLLEREIPNTRYNDLTSVYGYPSPLVYGDASNDEIVSMWSGFTRHLIDSGYISLFTRLHPLVTPEYIVDLCGIFSGKVVVIDLSLSQGEQIRGYRKGHKCDINTLKKKEVDCYHSNDEESLHFFILNYEATMRSLNASSMYFFPEFYYRDLLNASNFETRIYSCKYDNVVICSGIFVFCGEIVQYHLSGSNPDYYRLAGTKMMIDTVRTEAFLEGKKYFVLGGGLGAAEDNLFKFKSGFSKRTENFNVIKLILNEQEYEELSSDCKQNTDYFPKYRATK